LQAARIFCRCDATRNKFVPGELRLTFAPE
jgi:hypothetical protein